MARPSAFITLGEDNFLQLFSDLFFEHVEGFTGLRRAKREKTDKDKNMEWRVRLKEKQQIQGSVSSQTVFCQESKPSKPSLKQRVNKTSFF